MKKVKVRLQINEVLKYQREAVVEIPDTIPISEFNMILDEAQRQASFAEDVTDFLEDNYPEISAIERLHVSEDGPWGSEVEIRYFNCTEVNKNK